MAYATPSFLAVFGRANGWIFVIGAVAGLLISVFGINAIAQARALMAEGSRVQATINGLRQTGRAGASLNEREYYAQFFFDPGTGQEIVVEQKVSKSFYDGLEEGQVLDAIFPMDHPEDAQIEPVRGWRNGLLAVLGGLVLAGAGVTMIFSTVGRARAWLDLPRTGQRRGAVVTAHLERNRSNDTVTGAVLEWRDETGVTGVSLAHPPASLPAVGSEITIFAGGGLTAWEGDVGSR